MLDFAWEKSKIFLLSPDEHEEMLSFVRDQLWKEYIRPSLSLQTSPMFFVPKLKTTAKCMCTDYWCLNKKTIKNNYSLPLISEMIDKIGDAKVVTRLDLQWGFNNVWINEMSGKLHSHVMKEHLNLWLCTLVLPIHQVPHKSWWMLCSLIWAYA